MEFESQEKVLVSGYLEKLSRFGLNWNVRFVTFNGEYLRYYNKEHSGLKAELKVILAVGFEYENVCLGHGICVHTTDGRKYSFLCPTLKARTKWLECINNSSEYNYDLKLDGVDENESLADRMRNALTVKKNTLTIELPITPGSGSSLPTTPLPLLSGSCSISSVDSPENKFGVKGNSFISHENLSNKKFIWVRPGSNIVVQLSESLEIIAIPDTVTKKKQRAKTASICEIPKNLTSPKNAPNLPARFGKHHRTVSMPTPTELDR